MAKRKNNLTGLNKFTRAIGLWSAFFIILASLTVITTLTMNMLEIFPLESPDGPREYWIQFESEGRLLFDNHFKRGEKFNKPADPTHSPVEGYSFTFRGWDISGDGNPDIIPSHAYYSFLAVAVFHRRSVKPLPKSSDPGESSENGEALIIGEIYG